MTSRILYAFAVAALLAGIAASILMEPRACGMDDILSSCGSGARYGSAIGGIFFAALLGYVGRALKSKN